MLMEEAMTSPATVEIQVDLPAGIRVCEYERIEEGHAFHVEWDWPLACSCETCKREAPLNLVEKNKFLSIRDLDIWEQPSFFVYREAMHRCPHCGHRQSLIPPFKRRCEIHLSLRGAGPGSPDYQHGRGCGQTVGHLGRDGGSDREEPHPGRQGQEGRSPAPDRTHRHGRDQPAERPQGLRDDSDGSDRSVAAGN